MPSAWRKVFARRSLFPSRFAREKFSGRSRGCRSWITVTEEIPGQGRNMAWYPQGSRRTTDSFFCPLFCFLLCPLFCVLLRPWLRYRFSPLVLTDRLGQTCAGSAGLGLAMPSFAIVSHSRLSSLEYRLSILQGWPFLVSMILLFCLLGLQGQDPRLGDSCCSCTVFPLAVLPFAIAFCESSSCGFCAAVSPCAARISAFRIRLLCRFRERILLAALRYSPGTVRSWNLGSLVRCRKAAPFFFVTRRIACQGPASSESAVIPERRFRTLDSMPPISPGRHQVRSIARCRSASALPEAIGLAAAITGIF